MHSSIACALAVAVLAACGARLEEPDTCSGGSDAISVEGFCFISFAGPLSRDPANAACEDLGAHLAFVRDAAQNAAIASIITVDSYLGASDLVTAGTFLWDDNSAFTYTSWKPGEPNNGGTNGYTESCMVMEGSGADTSEWDDRPCSTTQVGVPAGVGAYGYVCER